MKPMYPGTCSILIFLGNGLGTVSLSHFLYDFWRKIFLILYSLNWPNFIVWLLLHLETLRNMWIAIFCAGCEAIIFEINVIFLIKPFLYMTEKSRQEFRYLGNENSFSGKMKSIFHDFWWVFSCQKLSQTWECAFKEHESFSRNINGDCDPDITTWHYEATESP